jgi:hypothetical protein
VQDNREERPVLDSLRLRRANPENRGLCHVLHLVGELAAGVAAGPAAEVAAVMDVELAVKIVDGPPVENVVGFVAEFAAGFAVRFAAEEAQVTAEGHYFQG